MNQVLSDISILDLTTSISGAFGTMLLADMGATVVKVEDPVSGCPLRTAGPEINGEHPLFTAYNRNKKSISLDIKNDSDIEKLKSILDKFDAIVSDFTPKELEKKGLDFDSLKGKYPGIISVSITPFGTDNSYETRPACEETLQAESGLEFAIMDLGDGNPHNINVPLVETTGGYYMLIPLLAALHEKNKTGIGQYIEINKYFSVVSMTHFNVLYYKYHNILYPGHVSGAPIGFAKCKDGMVQIMSDRDNMWMRTLDVIDDPELHDPKFMDGKVRKANAEYLMQRIEKWLMNYTIKEIDEKFTKAGLIIGYVRNVESLSDDPHIMSRNQIVSIDVPNIGEMSYFTNPIRMNGSDVLYHRAPFLGENNSEYFE